MSTNQENLTAIHDERRDMLTCPYCFGRKQTTDCTFCDGLGVAPYSDVKKVLQKMADCLGRLRDEAVEMQARDARKAA